MRGVPDYRTISTEEFEAEALQLRNEGYDTLEVARILSAVFLVEVREAEVYNVLAKHGHTASGLGYCKLREVG